MKLEKLIIKDNGIIPDKDFTFIKWDSDNVSLLPSENFINTHSFLLVCKGRMQLKVNKIQYTISEGHFADFLGEYELQFMSKSPELEAYFLFLGKSFDSIMFKENPPFPISYPLVVRVRPILSISSGIMYTLARYMKNIDTILMNREHLFRSVVLKCEILQLVMEVANYRMKNEESSFSIDTKRKRDIFLKFNQLLIESIHTKRSVEFYADKLCISPQYLSRVVKEVSGRTVHSWICTTLLSKIVSLMNDTEMSIMQIADQLNFSDQASLNKFFKKYTGVPPSQYRKSLIQ